MKSLITAMEGSDIKQKFVQVPAVLEMLVGV
jgi:hypothetical protein